MGGNEDSALLEREKLRLERQRLALEVALKRREYRSSGPRTFKELLGSPILIALAGGLATVMAGVITAGYTAARNREAASESFQAELIKKFVEGPNRDVVRENLRFLAEVGLIPNYDQRIRNYLSRHPASAPSVSSVRSALVVDPPRPRTPPPSPPSPPPGNPMEASDTARRLSIDNRMPPEARRAADLLRARVMAPVEARFRKPLKIRSGYRSPQLTKAVGGLAVSAHTRGEAVDFSVPGVEPREVACWIRANLDFDDLILEPYFPAVQARPPLWVHVSYRAAGNRKRALNVQCPEPPGAPAQTPAPTAQDTVSAAGTNAGEVSNDQADNVAE
jgi:hypothetical protein